MTVRNLSRRLTEQGTRRRGCGRMMVHLGTPSEQAGASAAVMIAPAGQEIIGQTAGSFQVGVAAHQGGVVLAALFGQHGADAVKIDRHRLLQRIGER